MASGKKDLSNLIVLAAAAAIVVAAIVLSYARSPNDAGPGATEPRLAEPAGPSKTPPPAEQALQPEPQKPTLSAQRAVEQDAQPARQITKTGLPADVPSSRRAVTPRTRPVVATHGGYLPPLLPPIQGPETTARALPLSPPPAVLRLSGVIQGSGKLALLRRGESRYLVREGDVVEDRYRVTKITDRSVVMTRGRRTLTLRLDQS